MAALAPLATKYAGTLTKSGLAQDPSLQFVTGDGVRVRIDLWRLGGIEHTRFELTPLEPLPSFDVSARFLANLPTDDHELDRAFASRGDDTALLRRMWTQPPAQELFRTSRGADCLLWSKGSTLVAQHEGADEMLVEEMLELLLQIVRFDLYGTRAVAELPEATAVAMDGLMQAEVPGPSRLLVGPVTAGDVTRTRVMLSGAVTEISEDVRRRIEQLGAVVETSAEATAIVWPTIRGSA